jgi:hypothetical protein
MLDKTFVFGFNGDLNFRELQDLPNLIHDASFTYAKINGGDVIETYGGLAYINIQSTRMNPTVKFIKHPLWSREIFNINRNTFLPQINPSEILNLFEVLRKPASAQ